MKHLGDITKISGYDAPIVDTVIFGAPCQNLSVAGKRAGIKHSSLGDEETTDSGLFMEAVRIIKEMRDKDVKTRGSTAQFIRPRYAIYENVPGAFSSNKGEDFKIVLEELAKIADKDAVIPMPKKGKWTNAGCIVGDGWSIAWRILDGQFWGCTYYDDAGIPIKLGTPQRRKRIALVADFGGECAAEILFERKSLRGDTSQSGSEGEGITSDTEGGSFADDRKGEGFDGYNGCLTGGVTSSLGVNCGMSSGRQGVICYGISSFDSNAMKSDNPKSGIYVADTSRTLDLNGGNPACNQGGIAVVEPLAIENHPSDSRVTIDDSGKVQTLTGRMGTGGGNVPMVMEAFRRSARPRFKGDAETWIPANVSNTLNTFDIGDIRTNELVVEAVDKGFIDIEMEVAVRKHEVDTNLLCECLRDHKEASGFTNKDISDHLDVPITLVEHWFRKDKSFAIPDAEVWFRLKKILGIETDEFDKCITEYEFKGGNYDMRNRIHTSDVAPTVTCGSGNDLHLLPCVVEAIGIDCYNQAVTGDKAKALTNRATDSDHIPCVAIDRAFFNQGKNALYDPQVYSDGTVPTLVAKGPSAVCYAVDQGSGKSSASVSEDLAPTLTCTHGGEPAVAYYSEPQYIVRRLTPLECERLQGYPDSWTDIGDFIDTNGKKKTSSDAARYKALGNSICLPPWKWVLKRLCSHYERDATMASLFDGIGGFPYLWEQINGKGTAVWASEIEEFPIAVTKKRIN